MATAADPACPLFEVNPEPELDADIVGIEVIFPVGEEVVGGDGHEEIRINGEVVPDKPLQADSGPEDQGRIIFAEARVDKFEPEVRTGVGDRPALQERQVRDMEFGKAPEPVARELIEIARHFGEPADLELIARKVAKAAVDIEHHPTFLLKIQVAGQAEFLRPALEERLLRHRAPHPAEYHRDDPHTEQLFHRVPPRMLMDQVQGTHGERVDLSPGTVPGGVVRLPA